MDPELKKSNKKTIIIIAAVVAAIVLAVGVGVIVYSSSPARRLQQQLDLGARYLTELDYEQAIAAYEAALEIDPKSVEAYGGLIQVYGGQGDVSAVADTCARATDALDENGMTTVSTAAMDTLQEHAEEWIQEGQGKEVQQLLEWITEHTENEEIKEKEDQIRRMIAEVSLLWERPLYALILGGGYRTSFHTLFAETGGMPFDETVNFALFDREQMPDGIPEASVFSGNSMDEASGNCIYRFSDSEYAMDDGTEESPGSLRYFTQEEILDMGWDAFLAYYGYQSYLFTEYALEPPEQKDRPASGPVAEEDLTEEATEDIGRLAYALMMSLSFGSYESMEEIVRLFESEPRRLEMFFWVYYMSPWNRLTYETVYGQGLLYYCTDVQTLEADRLFSELFETSCDYSCLPTGFHDIDPQGYPVGAFYNGKRITAWNAGFGMGSYPEVDGYEHTANGTDLTVLYMIYDMGVEDSEEEVARIVLHLESAPNSYGFRITGCDITRTLS
ncbi:MAG: bacterial transcriptional activator domain-containing protein [Lachnospiraceae bacterium]|nr:bacterial transcriptional activator domain-containing protein [Lachnospiraceae bacterium]